MSQPTDHHPSQLKFLQFLSHHILRYDHPSENSPSCPCNVSCNTGIMLLAIGIGTSEEGGSGGVCGGDVGRSGG